MYPRLPLEILIDGLPVSAQAKNAKRLQDWKSRVEATARRHLPENHFALEHLISLTIYFFPQAPLGADLDNSAKPILDGLGHCVYIDDNQIERLVLQRFEPNRPLPVEDVTAVLEAAMESETPVIYVRVDEPAGGSE